MAPIVNLMCMKPLEDGDASGQSKFNSVENVRHIKFRMLASDWLLGADEFLPN